MVKQIIGGVVTVVIGGTTFAVSQTDVVSNLSKNTGMSKDQAQQYVQNIKQSDLESFSKLGQDLVSDGTSVQTKLPTIDCENYSYTWESPSLTCPDGKAQLQKLGNDEIVLGNCYQALDTNLGNSAKSKMNECVLDIDTLSADYQQPITTSVMDAQSLTDTNNSNAYNKSVLESAIQKN